MPDNQWTSEKQRLFDEAMEEVQVALGPLMKAMDKLSALIGIEPPTKEEIELLLRLMAAREPADRLH